MTVPNASPWEFMIQATDDEITRLRQLFDFNQENSVDDFLRTHVPFVEYHNDSTNDIHDENLIKVYEMIHQLGDEEARNHIESMDILNNFTSE
ncbi:hydrolase [Bacillus sp. FJAT-49870]|uniref:Hydrolase n=2 Tax=Lederbergia citri TaxID=2833580 RepID=A0A942YH69_9BACI|nr:hydrolase [Lederbergia citri]